MCECNHTNSRSKSSEKINKKDSRIEYRILGGNLHGHSVTSRPRVYFRPHGQKDPLTERRTAETTAAHARDVLLLLKEDMCAHTHTNRENVYTTRWKLSSLFSGCCNETERTETQAHALYIIIDGDVMTCIADVVSRLSIRLQRIFLYNFKPN
jgi:hypothetical protein